jgi:hypothetical protein
MGDITSPNGVWSQGVFTAKDGTKYEGERAVLADAPSLGDLLRGLFGGAKPAGNVPLPPKRPAGLGAKPADPNAFRNTEPGYSGVGGAILTDALNGPEPGFSGKSGAILTNALTPPEPGYSGAAGNTLLNATTPPEPGYSGLTGNLVNQDASIRARMMKPPMPAPDPFAINPGAASPALQVFNRRNRVMR